MKWIQIAFFPALLALAFSCKQIEDFEDAEVLGSDAEFAIPLVKARTTIQDLLDNFDEYTFIEIGPDGVVHLRYKGDVLERTSREILDEAEAKIFPIIPIEDTLYALPFSQPEELEVDFATYKSGTVKFAAKSDFVGPIDFTLTILQAKKNGVPARLHQVFDSPTTGLGGYMTSTVSLDLTGYDLTPEDGVLEVRYEAYTGAGERLKLSSVLLLNENVSFSYIEGYLGNHLHPGKRDTIQVEFFENWIQGDVFFENPAINISIENSFGIPTRSVIQVFDILTVDNKRLPLESDFITGQGIDFAYPGLSEVGQKKTMDFAFNSSNSNIKEVLGARPIALDYDVDALTNPDNLTDVRGFLTDSSFYKIQVDVDLPLYGSASGFGVTDTFDVDFDSYGEVKEIEFKMVADNRMPLAIDGQVYFLGETGAVLDSMFSNYKERIVAAAQVGADGIVTSPSTKTSFVDFTSEKFDKIRSARMLVLRAYFSTTNDGQQSVKAFADQDVEIRMGMKLRL